MMFYTTAIQETLKRQNKALRNQRRRIYHCKSSVLNYAKLDNLELLK